MFSSFAWECPCANLWCEKYLFSLTYLYFISQRSTGATWNLQGTNLQSSWLHPEIGGGTQVSLLCQSSLKVCLLHLLSQLDLPPQLSILTKCQQRTASLLRRLPWGMYCRCQNAALSVSVYAQCCYQLCASKDHAKHWFLQLVVNCVILILYNWCVITHYKWAFVSIMTSVWGVLLT